MGDTGRYSVLIELNEIIYLHGHVSPESVGIIIL